MNKNCMTTQQLLPHCLKLELSGTLRLNDRNRHTKGDTRCPRCNHEYEPSNTSYLYVML